MTPRRVRFDKPSEPDEFGVMNRSKKAPRVAKHNRVGPLAGVREQPPEPAAGSFALAGDFAGVQVVSARHAHRARATRGAGMQVPMSALAEHAE